MNRRESVLALVALGVSGVSFTTLAQQDAKPRRVGIFLSGTRRAARANEEAFLLGMKEHGYEAGRNLIVDTRYAEGDPSRYSALADELIALKPDVLFVSSTGNTIVTKSKTTTIPIVMGSVGDPVGDGIVQSLARPGGNVTGNSLQLVELGAKQIELLAEVLPRARRVALFVDLSQPKSQRDKYEEITEAAARAKGFAVEAYRINSQEDVGQALQAMKTRQADALVISAAPRFNVLRPEIFKSAAAIRLPVIGFSEEWPRDGALMSFSPSWPDAYRRAAYFVDRILKGAKPADLPVEQPRRFNLVVNRRVAKALGISIPQSILVRADRVIE